MSGWEFETLTCQQGTETQLAYSFCYGLVLVINFKCKNNYEVQI